jgi:hypothetical protein
VLVSPVPLFVRAGAARVVVSNTIQPELDDDVADSWGHPRRQPGRDALLGVLRGRFTQCERDQLLVISGDFHESALIQLQLGDRVVGWEVVSSGVAADDFDHEKFAARGLHNIRTEVHGWLSHLAGRIAGSPSFAEVFISGLDDPNALPGLEVAWWQSVDRQADHDANDTFLNVLPEVCELLCPPSENHPQHATLDVRRNRATPVRVRHGLRRRTECQPAEVRSAGDILVENLSDPEENVLTDHRLQQSCLAYSAANAPNEYRIPATRTLADWSDDAFCGAVCQLQESD